MKPLFTTILLLLCAVCLMATDYLREAEYYRKKADGFRREARYFEMK